jgi:Uma2 family endonuclease
MMMEAKGTMGRKAGAVNWRDGASKRDAYLTIPSLEVYLVAESSAAAVQVFRRSPDGDFRRELALGTESVISLPGVGASLSLADLYDGVEFEEEAAKE